MCPFCMTLANTEMFSVFRDCRKDFSEKGRTKPKAIFYPESPRTEKVLIYVEPTDSFSTQQTCSVTSTGRPLSLSCPPLKIGVTLVSLFIFSCAVVFCGI